MELEITETKLPKANLPPYQAVTEQILGICKTPVRQLVQWDDNFERLPHTPLNSPPFWWNASHKSMAPGQSWNFEDYNFKNCKWEGCYKPCTCLQREDNSSVVKCRYPNFCGYHKKNPIANDGITSNIAFGYQASDKKNICCFCKMKHKGSNISVGKKIPDPRCIGQYHQSLLENIIGRETTLKLGKSKIDNNIEKECLIRGYIPGDVHGRRGWSGHIGRDPMYEEWCNAVFPIEETPSDTNLMKFAENLDDLKLKKEEITRYPYYKCYYEDPHLKYGICPQQLNT